MTSFVLKIIACVTMFIDHLSYGLFGKMTWLNYIGRIAFPIFAFQIVEGYTHTKNLKKYFARLAIFAVISEIPFYLLHSIASEGFALNVMFTLLLGLFCIWIWDKCPNKFYSVCIIAITCVVAEFSKMDYGYWGVLLVFIFYLFRNNKTALAFAFVGMITLKYAPNMIKYGLYEKIVLLYFGTLTAIIPILLYNGKQGPKIKYFLYIFYPVHLILLYGLHMLIG